MVDYLEHTSVKEILVSPAASWLRSLSAFTERMQQTATSYPAVGLSIFFIGKYGRRALEEFRHLMRAHGHCNIALGTNTLHEYLACDIAIVVYEESSPDDRALAGVISEPIITISKTAITIGMHPFKAIAEEDAMLDLTLQTWQNHRDFMAVLLRTLTKVYADSRPQTNRSCLRAQLEDLLRHHDNTGVLLFQKTVQHYEEIEFPGDKRWRKDRLTWLGNPVWLRLVWIIVEMHNDTPRPSDAEVFFTNNPNLAYTEPLVLPHAGLADEHFRVTVFGFVNKY